MSIEDQIKKVFEKTWNIFSNNFVVLIVGSLLAIVLMIFIITIPPLVFGLYHLCLNVATGKKAEISDIFKGFNQFFRSWWLFIIGGIGIFIGLILLIIPGILLIILWQYSIAISVSENKSAIESLKKSYQIGKENFTFSLVLAILMGILSSIGGLIYIGTLLTIPFTILATITATKILTKTKNSTKKKASKKK